jgi:hypothetical protein
VLRQVQVAHRCLNVRVAHERLHVVERLDLSGESAEGVAKVVEGEAAPRRKALAVNLRRL